MVKFLKEIKGWGHSQWYGLLIVITETHPKTFWGFVSRTSLVIDAKRLKEIKITIQIPKFWDFHDVLVHWMTYIDP